MSTVTTRLKVTVHYVAAAQPFKDDDADSSETLASLKARALTAFGLVEESTPDGGSVSYSLTHEREVLEDLSLTLGEVAGDKKHLQLRLGRQVVQG